MGLVMIIPHKDSIRTGYTIWFSKGLNIIMCDVPQLPRVSSMTAGALGPGMQTPVKPLGTKGAGPKGVCLL